MVPCTSRRQALTPCLPCSQMDEHELDALAAKSRRTRRPDYDALADMLRTAAELPCAPAEEAALKDLLAAFERWEVCQSFKTSPSAAGQPGAVPHLSWEPKVFSCWCNLLGVLLVLLDNP